MRIYGWFLYEGSGKFHVSANPHCPEIDYARGIRDSILTAYMPPGDACPHCLAKLAYWRLTGTGPETPRVPRKPVVPCDITESVGDLE